MRVIASFLLLFALIAQPTSLLAEAGKPHDSIVRVLLKYRTPGLVYEGKFIAQSKLVVVNQFSGVVVDSEGRVATYIGDQWIKLGDENSSFFLETIAGKQHPATLLGVDHRISLAVLAAQGLEQRPAVFGRSFTERELQLLSWNEAGELQATPAKVLNTVEEPALPDVQLKVQLPSAEIKEATKAGGTVWDNEDRFLGFILEAGQAGFGKQLAAYSVLPTKVVQSSVREVVRRNGDVPPGWLGIFPDAEVKTLRIKDVLQGTPADRAGLRQGDYILKINGMDVRRSYDFLKALRWVGADNDVNFTVASDDEIKTVTARLIAPPTMRRPSFAMALEFPKVWKSGEVRFEGENVRIYPVVLPPKLDIGIVVDSVTPQLARFLKSPTDHGLLIKEVLAGSTADQFGFRAGDILVEINGISLGSPEDLAEVVSWNQDGVFTVRLVREGKMSLQKVIIQ